MMHGVGMVETFWRALHNSGRVEKFSTIRAIICVVRQLSSSGSSDSDTRPHTMHIRVAI